MLFVLAGQIAASAGVAYTSAMLIGDFIFLCTGGSQGGGFVSDQPLKLAWYAAVLLVLGLVNTLTVRALGIVGEVSGEEVEAGTLQCSVCLHAYFGAD